MTLYRLHRIHRWIAIWSGVFLVGWIVTGVIALVPPPGGAPARSDAFDLGEAVVPPADAVRALAPTGSGPSVRSIRLYRLGDALVYEVTLAGRGVRLVDAGTGRVVSVDAALALRLAASGAPAGASVVGAETLSRRSDDLAYRWGALPAHRVAFDDPAGTVVYVGMRDGSLRSTTRLGRMIGVAAGLHTFEPLDLVLDPAIRKVAMFVVGLGALAAAVSGYFIAFRRSRRVPAGQVAASRG
jgi:hypothetical protein